MALRWVKGLLISPLRVVDKSLGCMLSSERICEDVFSVGSPQALSLVSRLGTGLCRLCGLLCWSGLCTEGSLLVHKAKCKVILMVWNRCFDTNTKFMCFSD